MNPILVPPRLSLSTTRAAAIAGCIVLAVALVACSSVKRTVDKSPIAARTFSFLDTGPRATPSYAEDRKEAHAMIQQALIKNLASKGIAHVTTGGDVTVAYLVVVGNNVETTSLNGYFGYGDDAQAWVEQIHKEQAVKGDNREYFESGTLVIDFIDPKTSKLLQRRSIQAQVLRNLPAETRSNRVQSIVDQALKDLPVSS
jgi:hypothetical protein